MHICDRWFERRTVDSTITLLWEPHVHPFLRCNIWHVRGRDRDMLIDTGLGIASLAEEIVDLTDKPLTAVATHIHYDHVGSMHEFDERVMHEIEAPRLAHYSEFATLRVADIPQDLIPGYNDPAYGDYFIKARPSDTFTVASYGIKGIEVTRTVIDGDVIDLGNRHFEVMHLPGHSPGSIGLYEAASSTLFSGDAIYDGPLLDQLPDSNVPDYVATMRRLRGLNISVVHGGHEASFGRQRLIEIVDRYLQSNT